MLILFLSCAGFRALRVLHDYILGFKFIVALAQVRY